VIESDQTVNIGAKVAFPGLDPEEEMTGEEVIAGADINPDIGNVVTEWFGSGFRSIHHDAPGRAYRDGGSAYPIGKYT
jgi:hypothetical protein